MGVTDIPVGLAGIIIAIITLLNAGISVAITRLLPSRDVMMANKTDLDKAMLKAKEDQEQSLQSKEIAYRQMVDAASIKIREELHNETVVLRKEHQTIREELYRVNEQLDQWKKDYFDLYAKYTALKVAYDALEVRYGEVEAELFELKARLAQAGRASNSRRGNGPEIALEGGP